MSEFIQGPSFILFSKFSRLYVYSLPRSLEQLYPFVVSSCIESYHHVYVIHVDRLLGTIDGIFCKTASLFWLKNTDCLQHLFFLATIFIDNKHDILGKQKYSIYNNSELSKTKTMNKWNLGLVNQGLIIVFQILVIQKCGVSCLALCTAAYPLILARTRSVADSSAWDVSYKNFFQQHFLAQMVTRRLTINNLLLKKLMKPCHQQLFRDLIVMCFQRNTQTHFYSHN